MELLTNPVIQNLIAFGGGALGISIVTLIYNYFRIRSMLTQGGEKLGNYFGLQVKRIFLDKIPDKNFREKMKSDIDASSDMINQGFDKGINGIVVE